MTQNLKTSALIVVLSGMCGSAQAAGTDDKATPSPPENAAVASPGMKVYIDPETGELLEQPPKGTQAMVTPSAALPEPEQVESPVPGGGVMVDVRKRFQTPLQVRMGSDGKPVLRHGDVPSAPPK